jgi:exodeoxyribonuclease III
LRLRPGPANAHRHPQLQRHPIGGPQGLLHLAAAQRADVVCLQETKAQEHQLDHGDFRPKGWHCFYYDAQKKGYAGVALFSRTEPTR